MKKFNLIIGLALAITMFSCSKDEDKALLKFDLTSSEITTYSALVSFDAVEGAYFYDIEIAKKGEEFEYLESIDANSDLAFRFTDLLANTEYEVKVTAWTSTFSEVGSGNVSFTTEAVLEALVGKWTYTNGDNFISYTFNEDGYGLYETPNGSKYIRWYADSEYITITTYANEIGGISDTGEELSYQVYEQSSDYITIDGTTYWAPVD